MSEKRHELYLIAFALVSAAVLILYIAFDSPQLNTVEVAANKNVSMVDMRGDETEQSQTQALEEDVTQTGESADVAQDKQSGAVTAKQQTTATAAPDATGLVNLNTATKEQLMTLAGIGEVKATAIIDYRRENGNFYTVGELTQVSGIGDKTLENIRASITV